VSQAGVISAKLEDYLEAIFNLVAEGRVARVSDIAERMGVQMPTVTGALKHLAEHRLVHYEPYHYITLTPQGAEIARSTIRRHDVLKTFMAAVLGLPEETADRDACGMEHALSQETLDRLVQFLEFIDACPRAGRGLVENFRHACDTAELRTDCENCIRSCLDAVRRGPQGERADG